MPAVGTTDQIANQLTNGYWGGDYHRFDVAAGGTITVNLTGLIDGGHIWARAALDLWTDIIGINFVEVTSGGQIVFDDNAAGAFSEAMWSGHVTTSAFVNISSDWLSEYGGSDIGQGALNNYAFQTYLHEIGHALGLGHPGNYDGDATFATDALFDNDCWATTVMSYFDQHESNYFAIHGGSIGYAVTPMFVDIAAMSQLYGLSTTTRAGDTTYGYNSNAGNPIYDATLYYGLSFTIYDSGGIDTLDYSAATTAQQAINLNPEQFSGVAAGAGNRITFAIAPGVVIENAIGGGGVDFLTGNDANNVLTGNGGNDTISGMGGNDTLLPGAGSDMLTGGLGADTFQGNLEALLGDTILDFNPGDRVVLTDANLATLSWHFQDNLLFINNWNIQLANAPTGQFVAIALPGGGVQLSLNDAQSDFNGDGRSDILWRNSDGTIGDWLANPNGGHVANDASLAAIPNYWQVAGTGDFNGDGRDDILWRGDGGEVGNWTANANGVFTFNAAGGITGVATSWQIAGVGDFNGDGRDDILWRNTDGTIGDWLADPGGSHAVNNGSITAISNDWQIAGIGDFNGDGRDDILWRGANGEVGNWLAGPNGTFAYNAAAGISTVATSWQIAGVGDFNGDGRDDILWRNSDGDIADWLANPNGSFTPNDASLAAIPHYWQVDAIGDFNGDGRDDILWRGDGGEVGNWTANTSGVFAFNAAAGIANVPNSWHVEPEHSLL